MLQLHPETAFYVRHTTVENVRIPCYVLRRHSLSMSTVCGWPFLLIESVGCRAMSPGLTPAAHREEGASLSVSEREHRNHTDEASGWRGEGRTNQEFCPWLRCVVRHMLAHKVDNLFGGGSCTLFEKRDRYSCCCIEGECRERSTLLGAQPVLCE